MTEPLNSVIERFRIMEARRMKKLYRNKADDDDEEVHNISQSWGNYVRKKATFLDYLNDKKCDAGKKLEIIDEAAKIILPPLEGDKVTFIGTTFMRVGECEPYLNYMAVSQAHVLAFVRFSDRIGSASVKPGSALVNALS